jgi:glycosyltransferase involved in cell wall biosynthesis
LHTLIAIPVFNERPSLPGVLTRVLAQARTYGADVLVIDDGSTDGTAEALKEFPQVHILRHPKNMGYGRSLIDAFAWAKERMAEWVITMDCDEQHEPAELPGFFEAIDQNTHDIISGSRYLTLVDSGGMAAPADRRRINFELTREINERLGSRLVEVGGELLTDAFCGFKAHRVDAMTKLRLSETGYAFPMQLWVRAAAHGLRIRELPVSLIYNDPNRSFGAALDDADHRRAHYLNRLHCEIHRHAHMLPSVASQAVCCP